MSQENVETFARALEAYNRRDVDAFVQEFDPRVEWHPLTQAMFGGERTVYRGHQGIREFMREVDEALAQVRVECGEIRDLGELVLAVGRLHARGRASGAETESPIGWLIEFREGKMIRMRDFLDPQKAREAAGLAE